MRSNRLIWCLVVFIVVSPFGVLESASQSNKIDEPTVIQRGVMTDEQRAHSKLFLGVGTGKKITDLITTESEVRIVSAPPAAGDTPSGRPLSALDFIERITCKSDMIVVGSIVSKTSQLTADEDYVFTDFTVNVETVLDRDKSWIKPNSTIVISRPGGRVVLDGHLITAENQEAGTISVGKKYLLFLKNIPNSKGFTTLTNRSVALIDDGKLESISFDQSVNIFADKTLADVVDMVRISIASGCDGKK